MIATPKQLAEAFALKAKLKELRTQVLDKRRQLAAAEQAYQRIEPNLRDAVERQIQIQLTEKAQ